MKPTHLDGEHKNLASLVRASFAFHKLGMKSNDSEYQGTQSDSIDVQKTNIPDTSLTKLDSSINLSNVVVPNVIKNSNKSSVPKSNIHGSNDKKNRLHKDEKQIHKCLNTTEQGFLKEMYNNEAESHEKYVSHHFQVTRERNPIFGEEDVQVVFIHRNPNCNTTTSNTNNKNVDIPQVEVTVSSSSNSTPGPAAASYRSIHDKESTSAATILMMRNQLRHNNKSNTAVADGMRRHRSKIDDELQQLEMALQYKKLYYFGEKSSAPTLHPAMAQTKGLVTFQKR